MRTAAFIAALALVGCSRTDKTATEEPVSTTTLTMAPVTVVGPSDEELVRRANAANAASEAQALAQAELALPRVTGLVETLNELTVEPYSPPLGDDRIQFHIQLALLHDAAFVDNASDVDVHVDKGVVTLRGVATTPEVRTTAERIASRQSGVVNVDNRLRIGVVRPPSAETDRSR
jgi:osmotically-inducible protein OsmY